MSHKHAPQLASRRASSFHNDEIAAIPKPAPVKKAVKQTPTPFPGAKPQAGPKSVPTKLHWKFVERAPEETEALIDSLLQMCHVNGQPRIDALDQVMALMKETPPYGPRAIVSIIFLKGLSTMVTVMGVSCPESRHRASRVLQEAVAYGHGDKVHECKSWFFQVRRNLEHDNAESRASGAALLRVMKPTPECVAAISLLLPCLRQELTLAREEAAGALLQLTSDKVCVEEMLHGTLIQDMVHHFTSNRSLVVREKCSAVLAVLARASTKHRLKIINNEGLEAMLEGLTPLFPDKIVDNVLSAMHHMVPEERARKVFAKAGLANKLAVVISGEGSFHSGARRRAFSLLEALNKTPEGVKREPFSGIGDMTAEQDCEGLAQLFSLLSTRIICWRVRRVSRCWRIVTGMPETWQRVDFEGCSFMTSDKLRYV